jgi:hypothetical protein
MPSDMQRESVRLPSQKLKAPSFEFDDGGMDPNVAAQLLATEKYLARRQQQFQQQLLALTSTQFSSIHPRQ